jgi:hypothetical protein
VDRKTSSFAVKSVESTLTREPRDLSDAGDNFEGAALWYAMTELNENNNADVVDKTSTRFPLPLFFDLDDPVFLLRSSPLIFMTANGLRR